MKKFLFACCCFVFLLICSCNKDVKEPGPGPFFISYTTQGNDFYLSSDTSHKIYQGTGYVNSGGTYQFFPTTRFFPAKPHNENIYNIGFLFSSNTARNIDWVAMGNSIFRQEEYSICYTGVNWSNFLEGLACGGVTIYHTPKNGKLLNSSSVPQPPGNYFVIDTVTDFHSTDKRPYYDFDKIISGRFQCRVFNPEKHTEYIDLSTGKFRMPIWKNGFR